MNLTDSITIFQSNLRVFKSLLSGLSKEQILFRVNPETWNLLEIVCHLHDEERDDFRARLKSVLGDPGKPFSPIDPPGWVKERKYMDQDFTFMLVKFTEERERSLDWLGTLKDAQWKNVHHHPKLGPMSATFMLANWLAHDYLHIRQIVKVKYHYLKQFSGENLDYAGNW